MKKRIITGMMMCLVLISAVFMTACSSSKAPKSISFSTSTHIMAKAGETYKLSDILQIEGAGADTKVEYSSSDTSVAEVSSDGVITAKGYGTATITAVSAADKNVTASMDLAVYDYYGEYTGEKYVDAMKCDVKVSINIKDDGTYTFFRAPMNIAISGGGQMPELLDKGTYTISGNQIKFAGETLGEFTTTFGIENGAVVLSGKIPTGGAATSLELKK